MVGVTLDGTNGVYLSWYADGDSGDHPTCPRCWELGQASLPPNTGDWFHVDGVFEEYGSVMEVSLYINGTLVATRTSNLLNDLGRGDDWIIFGGSSWGDSFIGALDDVAVFDRALGAAEMANLASSPYTPVPEPSTVLLMGAGLTGFAGLAGKIKKAGF